jgi:hypothetical protein
MRLLSLAFFLTAACVEDTKIPTDTGLNGNDSGGGDTDTDTDSDTDTDTDTDSDTDTDTDTDTDSDTDTDTDTDTDVGPPVESDLTGRTYAIALGDATITEPAGAGSLLAAYITQEILLGVESVTDTQIEMIGTVAVDGSSPAEQNYCLGTIDFPTADFSRNPRFQVGPSDLALDIGGYAIVITGLEITGTFAADGASFDNGTLLGTIDTRPLDPLVGDTEGAICDVVELFSASCEPCTDGEEYCLTIRAEDVTGAEVAGLELSFVPGNNCEACEAGPVAADAVCDG